jgi:hypothetical protein
VSEELKRVWNTDAPPGKVWKCPDCESRATLGGNAAYHAISKRHGDPVLVDTHETQDPTAELRRELEEVKLNLKTLADFALTAPGRLPSLVQDAVQYTLNQREK